MGALSIDMCILEKWNCLFAPYLLWSPRQSDVKNEPMVNFPDCCLIHSIFLCYPYFTKSHRIIYKAMHLMIIFYFSGNIPPSYWDFETKNKSRAAFLQVSFGLLAASTFLQPNFTVLWIFCLCEFAEIFRLRQFTITVIIHSAVMVWELDQIAVNHGTWLHATNAD